MDHPTEREHTRLIKLTSLTSAEMGAEIVDLLRTCVVLHHAALDAWLGAGAPAATVPLPEVDLFQIAVQTVAVALHARFDGTPLGTPQGPDTSGALQLLADRLATSPYGA